MRGLGASRPGSSVINSSRDRIASSTRPDRRRATLDGLPRDRRPRPRRRRRVQPRATELSQHASDCRDRREPFKSCSPRIPARSCGGCDWWPLQSTSTRVSRNRGHAASKYTLTRHHQRRMRHCATGCCARISRRLRVAATDRTCSHQRLTLSAACTRRPRRRGGTCLCSIGTFGWTDCRTRRWPRIR